MPETRYVELFKDGKLIKTEPFILSNEQLADEVEANALAKVGTLIDAIGNLADAKVFLKRLCARLIKKGLLP